MPDIAEPSATLQSTIDTAESMLEAALGDSSEDLGGVAEKLEEMIKQGDQAAVYLALRSLLMQSDDFITVAVNFILSGQPRLSQLAAGAIFATDTQAVATALQNALERSDPKLAVFLAQEAASVAGSAPGHAVLKAFLTNPSPGWHEDLWEQEYQGLRVALWHSARFGDGIDDMWHESDEPRQRRIASLLLAPENASVPGGTERCSYAVNGLFDGSTEAEQLILLETARRCVEEQWPKVSDGTYNLTTVAALVEIALASEHQSVAEYAWAIVDLLPDDTEMRELRQAIQSDALWFRSLALAEMEK